MAFLDIVSPGKDSSNQISALLFGLAITGIILFYALAHIGGRVATHWISKSTSAGRTVTSILNVSRSTFTKTTLSKPNGRLLIVIFYLATNATVTLLHLDFHSLGAVAKRLGWMAVCNLCLTVFLAMKNTPLSFLTGRSHHQLNVLHRCSGFMTILFILAHGGLFIGSMVSKGHLSNLQTLKYGSAVIAALSAIVMLATAIKFVRQGQYELFKLMHTIFGVVILFMVGYHTYATPILQRRAFLVAASAAGLWTIDRVVRGFRWVCFLLFNHCTITPLPCGATRVVMRRGIRSATPGSHAYLWIPGVRIFEAHPFTMISPTEFVITAREGFTRKLYNLACEHPDGLKLRAAVEGPYGASSVPAVHDFDKVILVAGGSGATFTVPLALDWVKEYEKRKSGATLEFVWAVKNRRCLEWFDEELSELQACTSVNLSLHVTEESASDRVSWPFATDIDDDAEEQEEEEVLEKLEPVHYSGPPTIRVVKGRATLPYQRPVLLPPETEKKEVEVAVEEKEITTPTTFWNMLKLSKFILSGRPNVDDTLYAAAEHLWQGKRVLVAACGPKSLLEDTRVAVTARMKWNLPEMQMHLEEFAV